MLSSKMVSGGFDQTYFGVWVALGCSIYRVIMNEGQATKPAGVFLNAPSWGTIGLAESATQGLNGQY